MYHQVYQMKKARQIKKLQIRRGTIIRVFKAFFWFITGALLATLLLSSFTFIIFQKINSGLVYPGITINSVSVGRYTQAQVEELFAAKNKAIEDTQFTFSLESTTATISAKDLNFGYDQKLIARQAISLGRSNILLSNISIVLQSYLNGLNLSPSYHYSEETFNRVLTPFAEKVNKEPINAIFDFQNGKVLTFKPSENGQMIDIEKAKKDLTSQFEKILLKQIPQKINLPISVKTLFPKITTDKANNLGIKEMIGMGTSLFQHSIQGRIFNVTLAASKINGALIAPNEIFSFDKALGDVSAFTGYKQAYIIQNGKTVLGDGGGVCQVSTTFFRALLNAGLPITERHAHAYRVGYYEEDGPPGLDATIFSPDVDLKFKNDTDNYILVQTRIDPETLKLSIFLYGTLDGRTVTLTQPIVSNRVPPPPDQYQDDPTLPKGTLKQVDFSAEGSKVSFSRVVTKNGKKIISENYISNYAPWQSIYLRGTKE
jgi:vancomycin resistance protein YoaR